MNTSARLESLRSVYRRWKQRLRWNKQYSTGFWDFLKSPAELERLDAEIGLMTAADIAPGPMLEVGCGEGEFLARLPGGLYTSYLGFDLSGVAIRQARKISAGKQARLIVADMTTFSGAERFQWIVMNECLYYSPRPQETFERYVKLLAPGGRLLLSVYHTANNQQLVETLCREWPVTARLEVKNAQATWYLVVFAPRAAQSH